MPDPTVIREIITDFHQRELPAFTRRMIDLSCPENKIRCLTGIRRSGKTFTFYQLITELLGQGIEKQRILYVNFEDERLLPLSPSGLSAILNAYYEMFPAYKGKKVFMFFDEIQNVLHWEKFIRRVHDTENVQINLTGSSSQFLSREIATALRGRTLSYEIFPFSFAEFLRYKNIPDEDYSSKGRALISNAFEAYLYAGGFPEIAACAEEFRLKILQEYFNLILYKDLIERYHIRNHSLIKYLLKFLLANNANAFSVHKFYGDAKSQGYKCSKDALHNYLSYLEDAYCFSLTPIFSESLRIRQVNNRKIYAIDHGLVTAMASSRSYNTGRLLETMVHNQLRRKYGREQIFYYKTSAGHEIDFVALERSQVVELIQVCEQLGDPATKERETRASSLAMQELNLANVTIITRNETDTLVDAGRSIRIIPFHRWAIEQASK
ncbi:ATP-binding protein [candidate division KSB1 bacterium]|nr:ATP-binding protein [candidate division KSB1 bacterium]